MPTMQDVAKHAGVALSTVSYAINGTRPISEETRQRIFASMDTLGYRPNILARGLASKRSRIIALLLPAGSRGLGLTELGFVLNAAETARQHNYHLVLWTTEFRDVADLQQLMGQGLVDGVVVMEIHEQDARIEMLRQTDFPFTMIGRCADNSDISHVDIDFGQTVTLAVDHLTELGHRQFAFINHSRAEHLAGYGPTVRAESRFHQTMAARELSGVSRFCGATSADGYTVTNELLANYPELTALIVMNDRALPGILRAIRERGLDIPNDISLVAIVSSAQTAEMATPALTTAEAPARELGKLGVQMLIQHLENDAEPFSGLLVPCELVVRGSSATVRAYGELQTGLDT